MTEKDIERITAYTGSNDFWLLEAPREYLENRIRSSFDPNLRKYVLSENGKVYTLRHAENGSCMFLKEKGCELPMEIRPLYCRIHPYDFVEDEVTGITFVDCPVNLLDRPGDLPDMINIKYDDAKRWVKMFYNELREGKTYNDNRNNVRSS